MMRAAFWIILLLAAALGLWGIHPPAALGPEAPAKEFSAARAITHLSHFATVPHPVGSPENARVREYLVATLRGLGLTVQVEEATIRGTKVQNIVAILPGIANQRAVMLVAHYDSVPAGPGAADDGAGVVSILETVRAIRAGTPLPNDIVVLLTDGEEQGLLGAAAFVRDHPRRLRHSRVLLNLEARGSSGPVLMFETSENNGWLIRQLARAAPCPQASSLMYSVYRLMPNDTDVTELKKARMSALNFAFSGTVANYHTANDTIANLDPRSVQQMGANTLALARHFGALPMNTVRARDCIYFNWAGCRLLVYSVKRAWEMAAATVLLLLAAIHRGRQTPDTVLFSGWMLLAVTLMGMAALWFLPGGSYVLQIPALLGAASLLLGCRAQSPALRAWCGLLGAWPITYLFAPLAYLLVENLGFNAASLGAITLLACLLVGCGWPLFGFLLPVGRKKV